MNPFQMRQDPFRQRGMARMPNQSQQPEGQPRNNLLICANCQNDIDPTTIALHHCEGGCICRTCVEQFGSLDSPEIKPTNKA